MERIYRDRLPGRPADPLHPKDLLGDNGLGWYAMVASMTTPHLNRRTVIFPVRILSVTNPRPNAHRVTFETVDGDLRPEDEHVGYFVGRHLRQTAKHFISIGGAMVKSGVIHPYDTYLSLQLAADSPSETQ